MDREGKVGKGESSPSLKGDKQLSEVKRLLSVNRGSTVVFFAERIWNRGEGMQRVCRGEHQATVRPYDSLPAGSGKYRFQDSRFKMFLLSYAQQ